MDTKINIYILSIFLKQHNFLKILIVISLTRVMSTQKTYIWNWWSTKSL